MILSVTERNIIRAFVQDPTDSLKTSLVLELLEHATTDDTMPYMDADRAIRQVFTHIQISGTHWLWLGATDVNGRPIMRRSNKLVSVHRWLWEAHGHLALGTRRLSCVCGETRCTRPEHHKPGGKKLNRAAMREGLLEMMLEDDRQGLGQATRSVVELRGKAKVQAVQRKAGTVAGRRLAAKLRAGAQRAQ